MKILVLTLLILFDGQARASAIEDLLREKVEQGLFSGASVLIKSSKGPSLFFRAGDAGQIYRRKIKRQSYYDLASISKVYTAIAVMKQIELKHFSLSTPIGRFYPFLKNKKADITIEHLLRHQSGVLPWAGPKVIKKYKNHIHRYLSYPLEFSPGEDFLYSDLGYMILGDIVSKVTGMPLNGYLREVVFPALGLDHTFVYQLPHRLRRLLVKSHRRIDFGVIHDPLASLLPSGSGHAGVIAAIDDVYRLGAFLLGKGPRFLKVSTLEKMRVAGKLGKRGLGLDLTSRFMQSFDTTCMQGEELVAHTGFTGTSLMLHPKSGSIVVILGNRSFSKLPLKESAEAIKKTRQQITELACKFF